MAVNHYAQQLALNIDKNKMAVQILKAIYIIMLDKLNVPNYRIEVEGMKIRLRESSTIAVSYKQRKSYKGRVESITAMLKTAGLLNCTKERLQFRDRAGNECDIYVFKIKDINADKLLQSITTQNTNPHEIELADWNAIPEPVQIRWNKFSKEMQGYIIDCIKPHAQQQLATQLSSRLFSESVRDPMMTAIPKIPVRFKEEIDDQFMDLCDVIRIQRHSEDKMRHNPFNREPFKLSELVPARDKLARIQEQARAGHYA